MMDLHEAKRILAALEREGVEYVLIGSMAMAAQGLIRATRDLDFFVSPSEANIERLRRALRSLYDNDSNVEQILAADLAGDYPAIEYRPIRLAPGVRRYRSWDEALASRDKRGSRWPRIA